MFITVHAVKTSLQFLNRKLSQKPVPGLAKFQHDQKVHPHYYHLQLDHYPLYVYFVINEGKEIGGSWEEPGKSKKHETEIAIRNKPKMLNDESMILKIGNYNFGEGPDFVAKEVHYHHECKRNYLHKKDKSSNIKDSALEKLVSYVSNKIIVENKPELASFLLDLYKQDYATKVEMKMTWLSIMFRICVICYNYAFL